MLENTQNNQGISENTIKPDFTRSSSRQNLGANIPRKTGKWTSEEDELLKKYVPLYGEKQWRKISDNVPGRTSIQCLHRWTKILKPGLVKGPWTTEEDQKLIAWVQTEGPTRWAQAAAYIKGRSGKQCRERWFNNLNPGVKKGNWTDEEDSQIFELYNKHGSSWSKIAKLIPGRTENAIKNRFYSTLRKLTADKKKILGEDYCSFNDGLKQEKIEPGSGENSITPAPNNLYSLLQQVKETNRSLKSSNTNGMQSKDDKIMNTTVYTHSPIKVDNNSQQQQGLTNILNKGNYQSFNMPKNLNANNNNNNIPSTINGMNPNQSNLPYMPNIITYNANNTNTNPNMLNIIKPQSKRLYDSKFQFNENEDSDINFERFLMNIEKNIADDMLSKEINNQYNSHQQQQGTQGNNNINEQDEIDKIHKSIMTYCNNNILDLGDSFKSILSTQSEETRQQKRSSNNNEYEDINSPRFSGLGGGNTTVGGLHPHVKCPPNIKKTSNVQAIPTSNNNNNNNNSGSNNIMRSQFINPNTNTNPLPNTNPNPNPSNNNNNNNNLTIKSNGSNSTTPIQSPILPQFPNNTNNTNPTKGATNDTLKNGLEMATRQNMLRNEAMANLQNNANNQSDNLNMIFDMISNMMNDKANNNEQKIIFLFQQLYSLENLLTNTRNELLQLESSIRNEEDEKRAKNLKDEDNHREDAFQMSFDTIQKKRHLNQNQKDKG